MKKKVLVLVIALLAVFFAVAINASAETTLPEECPHCGIAVTWEPIDETYADLTSISGGKTADDTKHYYLAFEADEAVWASKSVPRHVCIYMNGKTLTAKTNRVFSLTGTLSLIGEGTVKGCGFTAAGSNFGGAVRVTYIEADDGTITNKGTLNLYGPTITTTGEDGRTAARGGAIYVDMGTVNLYSGSVIGGHASNGGTIGIYGGATVNVLGGTVQGGTAGSAGGAVYIANGTLNVAGGTVTGGTAGTTGGAIHVHEDGVLKMSSGSISGGTATSNGGTVYYRGAGSEITGGTITGGTASNAGGALYIYKGCTFEMAGGKITGGTGEKTGNCVYVPATANITLSGSASIEEVHFPNYAPASFTVKGEVTGTVAVRGAAGEVDDGVVIGVAEDADLHRANYTVANTEYYVIHQGEDIVISTIGYVDPVTVKSGYCEACGKVVDWMAYGPIDYETNTYLRTGHYYIESEDDTCDWKKKYVVGNDRVCLDLNGKTLVGRGLAFDINKGTLNIMDTVGGGTVTGCGPTNVASVFGGTFMVRGPSTLNLYSGKLTYTLPTDGRSLVSRGGVIYALGTVNIYGGEVSGGAAKVGANIYIDTDADYVGNLGLYGGTVGGYTKLPDNASTTGICIITRGTLHMSGAPTAAQVRFTSTTTTPALGERVTIEGAFTGNVELYFSTYESGMDIGTAINADLSAADGLTINNDDTATVVAVDGQLICVSGTPAAMLINADGIATAYSTLDAAIEASVEGEKIVLLKDVTDLVVDKVVYLDLNGCDITNVSGSGSLVCMDSKTDDYTVEDNDYGRISGTVTCSVAGVTADAACTEDNYLMIQETDGISFHRIRLCITNSVLRPSCAGIYYISEFYGDEKVTAKVSTLGVALNAYEVPNEGNMLTTSLYTEQGSDQFNKSGTSCLLSGIMKTSNTDDINQSNSGITVYANAYIKLTDGTILFGEVKSTNLKEQAAAINSNWINLNLTQKRSFVAMFEKFDVVMRDSSWSVSSALSIADRKIQFATTDYTPYLAPWTHDVVEEAKADGQIHYYFMAGEGLHISDTQTYKDKWGDSCLVVFPNGQTLLIDVGPLAYAPVLAQNLERMGITHLDAILITHPHSDHHNGAFSDSALMGVGLLETITVDKVYYRGGYDLTSTAATLVPRTCKDLGLPCEVIDKGDVLQFGEVRIECVWPLEGEGDAQLSGGEEVNNMSIVLRFDYGEHSSLFTGDLYLDGEKMILERVDNSLLDVDFLKVPHHGYATSSSIAFIEAISPEVAMTTGRLPIPSRISNRYINMGIDFLDDRTHGYVEVTGAADGTLTYETSRNDTSTEEVPEVTPDEGEGEGEG